MSKPRNSDEARWDEIGTGIGAVSAVLVFIGSWIYCMSEYGFLFGFGLGWLPSLMLAAITGWLLKYLWPVVACILALAIVALFVN